MKNRTFAIATLGCKVNQYETQLIREGMLKAGYTELPRKRSADVYIINTCTVTQKTDKESRRLVREALKRNPLSKVIVTGCYAEKDSHVINQIKGVWAVVKNKEKSRIPVMLGVPSGRAVDSISGFGSRQKVFVKIQDGCDNFCSYCKIPYVRGGPVSRPLEDILREIKTLVSKGYREVILCGICLGAWGRDLSGAADITYLLREIIKIDRDFRIRLSSIEPYYVSDGLIDLIASSKKMCRHLHIPLQSGDDKILRAMNRRYTIAQYLGLLARIRKKIPGIAVTTDILAGFPGETREDFKNTLAAVRKARFSKVHPFSYSKRAQTRASALGQDVPCGVIRERIHELKETALPYEERFADSLVGKSAWVLVEDRESRLGNFLTGYTDTYVEAALDMSKENIGKIIPAIIGKSPSGHLIAKELLSAAKDKKINS